MNNLALCTTLGLLALPLPPALAATALPALDLSVSTSFGTTRREEVMLNRIVPYAGAHLGGVHVDTSTTPNRFYVFDALNNRVLGYSGFKDVTLPHGPFPPADIVIGQPALWDAGAANGDCTRFMQPTAATLALVQYPWINSTAETPSGGTMATDTNGNFYIVDKCNNRVLKYNDPFATDQVADEVWGQANFTSRVYATTASSLYIYTPVEGGVGGFTSGVDVERDGSVWVADCMNNRVLRFPQGAKTATLVLGQANFTTKTSGPALHQMYRPQCVRRHPITGEIFVLDGESYSWGQPCRVLVFASNAVSGASALREIGKSADQAIGLKEARGFAFDPFDTNMVWVLDGAHGRILKFNHRSGAIIDWIGYRSTNYYGTHAGGDGRYQRPDGTAGVIRQPDGDCGFDTSSNFYFTACYGSAPIVRIPLPLTRNGQYMTADNGNWVIASGEMMKKGMNEVSGRTMQDNYGMSRWGTQLYLNDGASCRLLVWTNYPAATTFQRADLVIGQDDFESTTAGGTFQGRSLGSHSVASNFLFIATDYKLFVFQLPITSGGRNYAPYKTVDSGQAGSFVWDDNGAPAYFNFGGIAYDAASNCLWVSNSGTSQLIVNGVINGNKRILRIRDPLGATPLRIDLVIGQTNKTDYLANHGLVEPATDARGLAQPNKLALDTYRNLYVVDGAYEGRYDGVNNFANLRVMRFEAAVLNPVPGNLFPLPAASGVFCKTALTQNRNWSETHRPHTPIQVGFGRSNEMLLSVCGYGNEQGERVFYYPTPHLGTNPAPTAVINTYFGQAAACALDGTFMIMQDHTWNRVLLHVPRATAPYVNITNAVVTMIGATIALGGTNENIVGTMRWSNEAGGGATFPAASPWHIPAVALSYGPNLLVVSGTNAAGIVGSDTVTVTRDYAPGEGIPTIYITNAPQLFPGAATTCVLGGNANQHAVGHIAWVNNRGGSGSVPATSAWVITGMPLSGGANLISVTATNMFGSNAVSSITMTRAPGPGEGTPYVDVTTPDVTVDENVTVYTINGTNNQHVIGAMWWNNSLGGGGTFNAATPWAIPDVPLQLGDNMITVAGSNSYGDIAAASVLITREVIITGTTWQVLFVTNGSGYAGAGTGVRMNNRSTLVKNYDRDGYVYLQAFAAAGNPRTQSIWRVRAATVGSMATGAWQLVAGGIPCNGDGGEPGQTWVKYSNVLYSALWCQFGMPNGSPWHWSWYGFYTTNAAGMAAVPGVNAATPVILRAIDNDFGNGARNIGGILAWNGNSDLTALCTDRDGSTGMDAQVRRWNGFNNLTTLSEKETESINSMYAACILDPKQNGRALFLDARAASGQNWIWCATNLYAAATNLQNAERRYQIPGSMTSDAIVDLALLTHPNFYGNTLLAASVWTGSRKLYLFNLERPDLTPLDITPATGLNQWRNTLAAHDGYLFMSYDAGSEAPGLLRLSLIDFNLQTIGVPEPSLALLMVLAAHMAFRHRRQSRSSALPRLTKRQTAM